MPKFDRSVLAKFLPPRYIPEFEQLNTSVDVDLPEATATAQSTADEARFLALVARANSDALRPVVEMLQTLLMTQRADRSQIQRLEQRVADLESQVALLKRFDFDTLRRQVADLQSFQVKR